MPHNLPHSVARGVRQPALAGRFYPADARRLRSQLAQWRDSAPPAHAARFVLAPHAGYPYSGLTAAHAVAALPESAPGRVWVLGPSHYHRFDGLARDTHDTWATPLGRNPLDHAAAHAAVDLWHDAGHAPHAGEHALEVELPFIQHRYGEIPIVPLLFGGAASPMHVAFGRALARVLGPNDVVVASSDLSHFYDEPSANTLDRHTLDTIVHETPQVLAERNATGACALCGSAAVVATMAAAEALGLDTRQLLNYRTSAQATGDTTRVVGYGAAALG